MNEPRSTVTGKLKGTKTIDGCLCLVEVTSVGTFETRLLQQGDEVNLLVKRALEDDVRRSLENKLYQQGARSIGEPSFVYSD